MNGKRSALFGGTLAALIGALGIGQAALQHAAGAIPALPVADTLKKKPANLTLLSKNNAGKFPYDHVYNMISGKEVVASHGTREMPIWGLVFAQRTSSGAPGRTPAQVMKRIETIIAFIESIQAQ